MAGSLERNADIIDNRDAASLFAFVAQEFLPAVAMNATAARTSLAAVPGKVVVGRSIKLPAHETVEELHAVGESAFMGLIFAREDQDTWRLRVAESHYRYAPLHRKVLTHYFVDVVEGQVTKAKQRRTFYSFPTTGYPLMPEQGAPDLIAVERDKTTITRFDDIYESDLGPTDETASGRVTVMYQGALSQEECQALQGRLQLTVTHSGPLAISPLVS